MTDYVLIHGAWHGSWCWARVRSLLATKAHRIFTPTLTGIGERSHLFGLDTHVADVTNLIIWEDLRDIVLVGHSYGGVVARHVADQMPDAFVPDNGKAVFDYLPDRGKSFRDLAIADGDGWKIPPPPARFFAVNPLDADWVDRQCTMHPLWKSRRGSLAPATTSLTSDTFWRVALMVHSNSFTPRRASVAGGRLGLRAGMM